MKNPCVQAHPALVDLMVLRSNFVQGTDPLELAPDALNFTLHVNIEPPCSMEPEWICLATDAEAHPKRSLNTKTSQPRSYKLHTYLQYTRRSAGIIRNSALYDRLPGDSD